MFVTYHFEGNITFEIDKVEDIWDCLNSMSDEKALKAFKNADFEVNDIKEE